MSHEQASFIFFLSFYNSLKLFRLLSLLLPPPPPLRETDLHKLGPEPGPRRSRRGKASPARRSRATPAQAAAASQPRAAWPRGQRARRGTGTLAATAAHPRGRAAPSSSAGRGQSAPETSTRGEAGSGCARQWLRTAAAETDSAARRAEKRPVPRGEFSPISPPGRSCGLDGAEARRAAGSAAGGTLYKEGRR